MEGHHLVGKKDQTISNCYDCWVWCGTVPKVAYLLAIEVETAVQCFNLVKCSGNSLATGTKRAGKNEDGTIVGPKMSYFVMVQTDGKGDQAITNGKFHGKNGEILGFRDVFIRNRWKSGDSGTLKWARHAKHHSPPSKWGNSPPNPGKGRQKCADSWCDCLRLCWYPHISLISYSTARINCSQRRL